jgi:penicillin amidase
MLSPKKIIGSLPKNQGSIVASIIAFSLTIALANFPVASNNSDTVANIIGINDKVSIYRDSRGIPHIEATNEADLYFTQGYVTASDRLWQMDLLRRTARGELAEIFGRIALAEDQRHRILGFTGLSENLVHALLPEVRAALESYSRGVNTYIESLTAKSLPPEFQILQYQPRPWTPADSLAIGKLFAETLANTWQTDIARGALNDLPSEKRNVLFIETSPLDLILVGNDKLKGKSNGFSSKANQSHLVNSEQILSELASIAETTQRSLERAGLYAEYCAASNNWVIAGKRSSSGKPLLANDPHLRASTPSIWYMAHLRAPGLHIAGVTPPGIPGIIIGHNEHIAWGVTNMVPDVQDIYLEKFDRENPSRYLTPSGWREAEVRREQILVRKAPAHPAADPAPFDVTVTRHGPIIFEQGDSRYALRWTALDKDAIEFEAFYALNRARNWKEFKAALSRYPGPAQNFVYADVEGHIGYYGAGRIPIRKSGNGSLPYDGTTDVGQWTGFIPPDSLPQLYDPPSGIIVTANNRIVGRSYPFHLASAWSGPYRARRIYELLTAKQKLTVEDFQAIQSDTYSFADAIFTGEVVKSARPLAGNSPEWSAMLTAFERWDAKASADSRTLALASAMREQFQQQILAALMGNERAKQYRSPNLGIFIDHIITTRPRSWLPPEFDSYEALLIDCYRKARADLIKQLGPDESNWTWGRVSQQRFPHPLSRAPFVGNRFIIDPLPQNATGTEPTVNMGQFVSMRLIVDTSDWDKTRQNIVPGQSGDPSSPHWKDQLDEWRTSNPREFPFSSKAVGMAKKQIQVFMPAAR